MKDNNLLLISICIPVFNEEENIPILYERLKLLAEGMQNKCNFEFVFTDNASTDNTWDLLAKIAKNDKRIVVIRFAKNIGYQNSILHNYLNCNGDAAVQLDADLQDPPEMIEQFFNYWQKGYKVVYGIRKKRQENVIENIVRKLGYWLIDKLSEHPIPQNAGDFRLIDRAVIEILRQYSPRSSKDLYLRGAIANMGFKQIGIEYARVARKKGTSKFTSQGFGLRTLISLIKFGLPGILNYSALPLRMASYIGFFFTFLSGVGIIYFLSLKIFDSSLPKGFTITNILITLGIGLQALILGVIGEYILKIYKIVRNEDIVIILDSINLSSK